VIVWFGGGSTNMASQWSTIVIFMKFKIAAIDKMCVGFWCTA